ncbi:threonine synthase [Ramlibacter sp. AN1015]|uniref:threonine synthase n=1 Tax=Ramlibacter sp. AN1015 TaxID=3133428 RepID=UPI0030C3196B
MNDASIERCHLTHLECSLTGDVYPAHSRAGLSAAGRPLLVRYDLSAVARALTKDALNGRPADMWRWRELLPVRRTENIVSLGEITTPLLESPRFARRIGAPGPLLIKDEGRLPTGSFKSRGLSVAVSMAKELGVTRAVIPTAGNAGAAFAAYCARAGIESFVFCPDDAPESTIAEASLFTPHVWRVNGLITDLAPLIQGGKRILEWYDMSTLKEPYRLEGKKTMGFELAEQFGWELPDFIFYPTGGGTGLIGMWKAFDELEAIGWIGSKRPRMVAVQSRTCAPIVRAFQAGHSEAAPWEDGFTEVPGVRVPWTVGDRLILQVLRESEGFAIAVDDGAVAQARIELAASDGINLCPEGAATLVAYRECVRRGDIPDGACAVLFNCASGLKNPVPAPTRHIDRHHAVDYSRL